MIDRVAMQWQKHQKSRVHYTKMGKKEHRDSNVCGVVEVCGEVQRMTSLLSTGLFDSPSSHFTMSTQISSPGTGIHLPMK